MKNTIIFDLDGTLANIDARRAISTKPNGRIDFKILHDPSNIHLDKPNPPVVKMAQLFAEDGFNIVIFSGRSDRTERTTRSWLSHNRVPFHKLVMRPDKLKEASWPIAKGNPATKEMRFMPDEILKRNMLDNHVDINDIFMVVDDRQKVVDMWRSLGLICIQVAEGNF